MPPVDGKSPAKKGLLARYDVVIGLEVHCQMKTKSKLFCGCSTEFGKLPNHNTCPVCLGLPGSLPVLNTEAVNFAVKFGLGVGATINEKSAFDRKQYFYPDLPKGYQITQLFKPYCEQGGVKLSNGKFVRLHHIHIEEDAGKNVHGSDASFVDLNRAGTPLIEIVSEPDIETAEEASEYLKRLRSLARHLDISDGNLEEGSFRCDANVSLKPSGQKELGTRCEIKNLNSFKNIERAIKYEILRQADVLDEGGLITQQTMLFDAASGKTRPMRSKEESMDYRYVPEPDLFPLILSPERILALKNSLPELPHVLAERFVSELGLTDYDAQVVTSDKDFATYFELVLKDLSQQVSPKIAANWLISEFMREANDRNWDLESPPISAKSQAELLNLVGDGTISGKIAKKVFSIMVAEGGNPGDIIAKQGLAQVSDETAILDLITKVIDGNGEQVEQYLGGKEKVFGFFVGQIMKQSGGKMNPGMVNKILWEELEKKRN
jgi:aspartyl-tRNA(Asn)/glutamyl-tRNA(Gln) amidotransferase subunit B